MTFRFRNLAVVVVANNHNVTILHPHFLRAEHIVPEDWKVVEGPICTPVMSTVSYDSGIKFQVEEQRLSVIEKEPSGEVAHSPVPAIVRSYVEKLPYVNYSALGINFLAFLPVEESETLYMERFLKRGPWWSEHLTPASFELTLSYPQQDGVLNTTFRPSTMIDDDAAVTINGLSVDVNCHVDVDSVEALGERLAEAPETIANAIETICSIVEIEHREAKEPGVNA